MELKQLYKNTIKVRESLKSTVAKVSEDNSEALSDLNRDQLSKGILSSGDKTEEYASIHYTNRKSSMGSVSVPNMDFKLTGALHAGINVKKKGDIAEFFSSDSKADFITKNWGEDVFGISPDNAQPAADIIEPDLFKVVENQLEKGIL